MTDAYLFEALRTPRGKGKADGGLAGVPPHELVRQLVAAMAERHGAALPVAVQRLALGCVTQVGPQGGHLALLSRVHAGLPDEAAAVTLNNYCVSGMSAIAAAARAIATDEEDFALAGGVESMSQSPFEADGAPFFRDAALAEHFRYLPPPIVADWLATQERLTREDLDAVTVASHQRAGAAWAAGHYASSVVPVARPDGTRCERDESVRPALTSQDLARFGPAFAQLGAAGADAFIARVAPGLGGGMQHLHCVAHCPPISDGAALVALGTRERGAQLGLRPRARIAAIVEANTDPLRPFEAGFSAFERVLARAGIAPADLGAVEFMEAFAAVPARFLRERPELSGITNTLGGHLAMGHPMGASGAILVCTLLAEMERRDVEWGVAVAHAVSGVGCAVVLQRS